MIRPHDADALTEALERFASEPGLVDQLGVNARANARNFTWDRQAGRQLAGYRAAVDGRQTKRADTVGVK